MILRAAARYKTYQAPPCINAAIIIFENLARANDLSGFDAASIVYLPRLSTHRITHINYRNSLCFSRFTRVPFALCLYNTHNMLLSIVNYTIYRVLYVSMIYSYIICACVLYAFVHSPVIIQHKRINVMNNNSAPFSWRKHHYIARGNHL